MSYGPVQVKVGLRDGRVVNVAPEFEDGAFFGAGEVLNWSRAGDGWIYDMAGGKPE